MSETTIVLGAAIFRDHRLFVARRSQPPSMAGFWELPGDESTGDERGTLQDLFATEFGVALRPVDQILSDRVLLSWRDADSQTVDAALRVWRCQFPAEVTFADGEPRPNMYRYDDTSWVPVEELDSVGPWRDEARIAAGEIADWFLSDETWQGAD
ncbi:NUDIX hydrolase [Actinophytocola algeriensis]|uniref:8-oxo-dGTP diphosphatase n=1 Tax=Actinophytocola algeriensis TaxID=1768010 RepID=A0A7W7VHM0_9PSEU|nr:hypothetical protein [Actinophytocola algeriensis]MBB4910200.1 8-oxo-dGTP diphosphatase [Actinophytocola algeriensis]MBE1480811.1 8-oxo-dGTP diphosphatase [Actinophytocola algeriensis]